MVIAIVKLVGFFYFMPAVLLSIFTLFYLPLSSVSLSFFILLFPCTSVLDNIPARVSHFHSCISKYYNNYKLLRIKFHEFLQHVSKVMRCLRYVNVPWMTVRPVIRPLEDVNHFKYFRTQGPGKLPNCEIP